MEIARSYQDKMEIALQVLDDEISWLVTKRDRAEAEAKIGYSCLIAVLRSERDRIVNGLRELRRAEIEPHNQQCNQQLQELQAGVDSATEEVRRILAELSQNEAVRCAPELTRVSSRAWHEY